MIQHHHRITLFRMRHWVYFLILLSGSSIVWIVFDFRVLRSTAGSGNSLRIIINRASSSPQKLPEENPSSDRPRTNTKTRDDSMSPPVVGTKNETRGADNDVNPTTSIYLRNNNNNHSEQNHQSKRSGTTTTHHSATNPTPNNNNNNSNHNAVDILFIVMGEAKYFPSWLEWLGREGNQRSTGVVDVKKPNKNNENNNLTVTFLYGAYDEPLSPPTFETTPPDADHSVGGEDKINTHHQHHQHTLFIPNTTWTQGRNQLAAEALLLEQQQGRTFDYWVFSDDDLEIACQSGKPNATHQRRARNKNRSTTTTLRNPNGSKMINTTSDREDHPRECWQRFLRFLASPEKVPSRATTISIHYVARWTSHQNNVLASDDETNHKQEEGSLFGVSTQDAMLAAIPRRYVPYFLPYATLDPDISEYISQAIIFCITKTCFPSTALYIPEMSLYNRHHRPYLRQNFSYPAIQSTVSQQYDDPYFVRRRRSDHGGDILLSSFLLAPQCAKYPNLERPDQDKKGPFRTPQEFDDAHISPTLSTTTMDCYPLVERFQDWQQSVLSNSR